MRTLLMVDCSYILLTLGLFWITAGAGCIYQGPLNYRLPESWESAADVTYGGALLELVELGGATESGHVEYRESWQNLQRQPRIRTVIGYVAGGWQSCECDARLSNWCECIPHSIRDIPESDSRPNNKGSMREVCAGANTLVVATRSTTGDVVLSSGYRVPTWSRLESSESGALSVLCFAWDDEARITAPRAISVLD